MHKLVALVVYTFALFGAAAAACIGLRFFRLFIVHLNSEEKDYKEYGALPKASESSERAWAVVTGASYGLGYEFALQLVAKGFNVFAIARSESKLKELSTKVTEITNGKSILEPYAFDLSSASYAQWTALINKVESIQNPVTILVNNAGTNQDYPEYFKAVEPERIENIATVNVVALTKLTRGLLPKIADSKSSSKKLVINVGSFAGSWPTPLLSTYSASKSYLSTFSRCLSAEFRGSDVHVENVIASFIATSMSKIKSPKWYAPSPETFVKCALDKAGLLNENVPYLPHTLMYFLFSFVPPCLYSRMTMKYISKARTAALKKRLKSSE